MIDEKSGVEQRPSEVEPVAIGSSLKEKDEENTSGAYIPQSDAEYNVTLKTWCVVLVSIDNCT